MKMGVFQAMCPESGLWMASKRPLIRQMTMTSQFADIMSVNFFGRFLFLLSRLVSGQISCQYHQ